MSSLLIFIIVVLIVVALLIAAWRAVPNVPTPLNWIVPVLVFLVAAIVIAEHAGLF
jgi:hypothetical protein